MPAIMIDVDYRVGFKDVNFTERSTDNQWGGKDSTARQALDLLDEVYRKARVRLMKDLTERETSEVMFMVPVPEATLSRVKQVVADWQAEEAV